MCKGYLKASVGSFQRSVQETFEDLKDAVKEHRVHLDSLGLKKTVLVYSNFVSTINKTPYSISLDDEHNEIILAIRGTASLEDAVIDLQLTPSSLREVGERCGFDGNNQFCHKGVLTRCIWIYDDLKRCVAIKLRVIIIGDPSTIDCSVF